MPLVASLEEAIAELAPDVVLDLSDEPVLGPPARFRLAARALALGVPYEGADFRLDPPRFEPIRDAVDRRDRNREARRQDGRHRACGAASWRGSGASSSSRWVAAGRPSRSSSRSRPTVADLLALSRAGPARCVRPPRDCRADRRADGRLPTLRRRSRRCRRHLERRSPASASPRSSTPTSSCSTAAVPRCRRSPPIDASSSSARTRTPAVATGYLNPYRALLADLVVVTMAESGVEHGELARAMAALTRPGVPVVRVVLRPRPLEDVRGRQRRVLRHGAGLAARQIAEHLERAYGADVVHVSGNLSDRAALRSELAELDCDVIVVEIKAAAIDVVAEEAARIGIPVVLAANDVLPLAGEPDLDVELERLATRRSRLRWWACERAPLPRAAAARRRRGPAVVEGADGACARRHGADADARLRARPPRRCRHDPARLARARPRSARGGRGGGCSASRRRPGRCDGCGGCRRCSTSSFPSCCSSAARPARGSRRSPPRSRIGSGSRG